MTIGNRPPTVRADGRGPNELRPVTLTLGVQKWAEGSCRIRVGDTEVLCAATIEDRIPPHLRGKGTGWVTAEYSMLPRATAERTQRESVKGRIGGRTHEIQRLIGRSLRGVVDLGQARRADGHGRLRRAAGRRRHAHRVDHRRLRRPRGGAHRPTAWSVTWWPRSRPCRRARRRAAMPRPRLLRGLARRGRPQRRRHRCRRRTSSCRGRPRASRSTGRRRTACSTSPTAGWRALFEAQAAVLATVRR